MTKVGENNMNLQESIRRILREEVNSADMKTVQTDLVKMMGPSEIKDGDRIKIVNNLISFNSSFNIIVDHLDQETLDKINKFMAEKGWFPISIGLSDMEGHKYSQNVKNYLDEDDVQIGYEANLAKELGVSKTKAFHVTPDIFIDKIKESGLTPKSESKLSDHPDRIYLFLNKNIAKDMVWTIWNSLSKERQQTIKDYYVLEIDLTQLPDQKFYHDPQTMISYEAIYTTQPIPKSAIKVIGKISTSDIKTKNDVVIMTPEEEKRAREEKRKEEEERIAQQKRSDSISDRIKKIMSQLPDHVKNMDISSLGLEESIRRRIRKELL